MQTKEWHDWKDNVLDFLCAVHDCPNRVPELQGKICCADYEGECNELECWEKVFTEAVYNPFYKTEGV